MTRLSGITMCQCGAVATGFNSSRAGGAVLWPLGLTAARLVVVLWCGAVATGLISSKAGGAVLWPMDL
jgi:hypothetical protein